MLEANKDPTTTLVTPMSYCLEEDVVIGNPLQKVANSPLSEASSLFKNAITKIQGVFLNKENEYKVALERLNQIQKAQAEAVTGAVAG